MRPGEDIFPFVEAQKCVFSICFGIFGSDKPLTAAAIRVQFFTFRSQYQLNLS